MCSLYAQSKVVRVRLIKKSLIVFFAAFVLLVMAFELYVLLTNNFHAVIPGEIYRSAQPSVSQLKKYRTEYGINSLIDLRGINYSAHWYQQEALFAKQYHLGFEPNLPFRSKHLPQIEFVKRLTYAIDHMKRPILMHCASGADRSGLAAAMALILSGDRSIDDMKKQVTWRYNITSPHSVGYQVMRNYLEWLKKQHIEYGADSFRKWVATLKQLKSYSGYFLV